MQERSKYIIIIIIIIIRYYEHMHIFIIIINTFHGNYRVKRVYFYFEGIIWSNTHIRH